MFNLQPHISQLTPAPPRDPAAETTPRAKLAAILGIKDRPVIPVAAQLLSRQDEGSYFEEKYSLDAGEGVQIPLYLLIPKAEAPFAPILAFHGHGPGVGPILGHYPDEATAARNLAADNNYAQALAEAGYLVCAIEQRGMGERITDQLDDNAVPRSCRHLSFAYMMHGRTTLGERCWDAICAINFLATRPDADMSRLGCTGLSGGGTTALFLTALEERITAAVVAGYFCSYAESILGMAHCECNYVPGVRELGEMGAIGALIAPRPLLLLNGEIDPIFPITGSKAQYVTVAAAYAAAGQPDACHLHIHPGGHAYALPPSLSWFKRWLG
ncbi:MAG: acetylxylan esterase [Ardenticatenales bacterium]|nr:acetylxylan esterase [Ardenticatenales bacterium]